MKAPVLAALACAFFAPAVIAEVNVVEKVADGVFFHEGDIGRKGHCNNGWIVFRDFVLVVDANFPSGAEEVIPKIKATSDKPIRFAFDTHHHGDHAYGNEVWHQNGATVVAHEGVLTEMAKYEPGRWDDTAKGRKDVAGSKLRKPALLFRRDMVLDDGEKRVELLHFGVAHTHGDSFAWLPKEKILYTGDAVVNGAYNFVGDGNVGEWIKTLSAVKKLGAQKVCPGHGPAGGPEVIDDQFAFFVALRDGVKAWRDGGKSAADAKKGVEELRLNLRKNEKIARYIGGGFSDLAQKVWTELGGEAWP